LADLDLGMKTQAEEVSEQMEKILRKEATEEEKLSAFADLQYLVHHVDAARDFVQHNGIQSIVIPSLNSSSHLLHIASLTLLGAASQGNPFVQLAALKHGVMNLILRAVSKGTCRTLDHLDSMKCMAAVHAISCLLRGFPAAQHNFMHEGGLTVLARIFDEGRLGIQVKITTLLHDLVLEGQQLAISKRVQNDWLGLEKNILHNGWCERIATLLFSPFMDQTENNEMLSPVKSSAEIKIRPEDDTIEKIVTAMVVLVHPCKQQFMVTKDIVHDLVNSYGDLAAKEQTTDDDTFYTELFKVVKNLSGALHTKDEL
jgi:hypothetical protein